MHLWVLEKQDSWSVREWHICVYLTFDTKLAVLLYWGRVWVTPVSPSSKWHTHCLLLLCRSAEKLWTRPTRQGGAYWRHDRVALPPARGSPCSRGKKDSTMRSQACPPWQKPMWPRGMKEPRPAILAVWSPLRDTVKKSRWGKAGDETCLLATFWLTYSSC